MTWRFSRQGFRPESEIEELCQIMRRYYEMNPDLP